MPASTEVSRYRCDGTADDGERCPAAVHITRFSREGWRTAVDRYETGKIWRVFNYCPECWDEMHRVPQAG